MGAGKRNKSRLHRRKRPQVRRWTRRAALQRQLWRLRQGDGLQEARSREGTSTTSCPLSSGRAIGVAFGPAPVLRSMGGPEFSLLPPRPDYREGRRRRSCPEFRLGPPYPAVGHRDYHSRGTAPAARSWSTPRSGPRRENTPNPPSDLSCEHLSLGLQEIYGNLHPCCRSTATPHRAGARRRWYRRGRTGRTRRTGTVPEGTLAPSAIVASPEGKRLYIGCACARAAPSSWMSRRVMSSTA